jgi:Ca-activated chloride channel family protein
MLDSSLVHDFHFLRPWWLLALVLQALILWLLIRHGDPTRPWRKVVASHLIRHLVLREGRQSLVRPHHLLAVVLTLATIALAGPTWQQEPLPFAEDEAALVIALDLSETMKAVDIQPSRLERAKQKIRDLLEIRGSAKTALIAYAGSAHVVLPLGNDPAVLGSYVDALSPDIMPKAGKSPVAALELAAGILSKEALAGTILFITDGIGADQLDAFTEYANSIPHSLAFLGVGTSRGGPIPVEGADFLRGQAGEIAMAPYDRENLEMMSSNVGAFFTNVTVDESDVARISRRIESHFNAVLAQEGQTKWKDFGYWLICPVMILALFWFRRGWTVSWLG